MGVSVLAFAGSLRKASLNKKLVAYAADLARARGAEVDLLDFADVAMPLYDGDLEASTGLPEGALALRRRIAAAHAVIIASPEYNVSLPGTLKNAIDWTSRPPEQPWRGKVVLTLSATGGPSAGARVLPDLRKILSALGAIVTPAQIGVPKAGEAFDELGRLKIDTLVTSLDRAVGEALRFAERLGPA
jgi:chromate reductase, NAD(P)H dehydrogenase (quinone)